MHTKKIAVTSVLLLCSAFTGFSQSTLTDPATSAHFSGKFICTGNSGDDPVVVLNATLENNTVSPPRGPVVSSTQVVLAIEELNSSGSVVSTTQLPNTAQTTLSSLSSATWTLQIANTEIRSTFINHNGNQ